MGQIKIVNLRVNELTLNVGGVVRYPKVTLSPDGVPCQIR